MSASTSASDWAVAMLTQPAVVRPSGGSLMILLARDDLPHAREADQRRAAAGLVQAPAQRSDLRLAAHEPPARGDGPVADEGVGLAHAPLPMLLARSHSANRPTLMLSRAAASRSSTSRSNRSRTSAASSAPTCCEVIIGFSAIRVSSARYWPLGASATDSPAAVIRGSNLSMDSADGPVVRCASTSPTTDSVMNTSRFLLRCWTRRSQKIWR